MKKKTIKHYYPLSDDIPALIISSTSNKLLAIIVLKTKIYKLETIKYTIEFDLTKSSGFVF